MRTRLSVLFVLSVLAAVSACSPSPPPGVSAGDEVRLRAEPDTVSPGGEVVLTLSNGSAETIGYNLCPSQLERRSGEEWIPVPSDRMCTMELRTLLPARDASYTMTLPADLTSGEYRYLTNVEVMDTGVREAVRSGPIRVEP